MSESVSSSSTASATSTGSANSNTFLAYLERKRADENRHSEVTLPVIPNRKQRRQLQVVEDQQHLLRAKVNEYNKKLPESVLNSRWNQRRVVHTLPPREKEAGNTSHKDAQKTKETKDVVEWRQRTKEQVSDYLRQQHRIVKEISPEAVRDRAREILQARLKAKSKEKFDQTPRPKQRNHKRPIPRFVTHTPRSDAELTGGESSTDDSARVSRYNSDVTVGELLNDSCISEQYLAAQRHWKNRFFEQVHSSGQQRKLFASSRRTRVVDSNEKSQYLLQALT